MNAEERAEVGIVSLPGSLAEALVALEGNEIIKEALGEHIYSNYKEAKEHSISWLQRSNAAFTSDSAVLA